MASTDILLHHIVAILDNLINVAGRHNMDSSTLDSLIILKHEANYMTDNRLNKTLIGEGIVPPEMLNRPKPPMWDRVTPTYPMTDEEYVKLDGHLCPYCGSNDLQPNESCAEFTLDSVFIPCKCLACNQEWSDQFRLVGYSPTTKSKERL